MPNVCSKRQARETALSEAFKPLDPPAVPGVADRFSEDLLLGGQVRLRQPLDGYRAAIDPVLLAASVDAAPRHRVLEAGAGHGAAAICLARRVPDCSVTGIEIQPDLVRLANDNARLNDLAGSVQVMIGDLVRPLPRVAAGGFDHVMANPPYLEAPSTVGGPGGGGDGIPDLAQAGPRRQAGHCACAQGHPHADEPVDRAGHASRERRLYGGGG